jgi:hypothetical protein
VKDKAGKCVPTDRSVNPSYFSCKAYVNTTHVSNMPVLKAN